MERSRTFDFFPSDNNIIIRQRSLRLFLFVALSHSEKPRDDPMERGTDKKDSEEGRSMNPSKRKPNQEYLPWLHPHALMCRFSEKNSNLIEFFEYCCSDIHLILPNWATWGRRAITNLGPGNFVISPTFVADNYM